MVGRMMSAGEPLPKAALSPTTEVGKSCKDVALRAKNIEEEYSAWGAVSKSFAALIP